MDLELEAIPDDRSALQRLGDTCEDSVDPAIMRECFPNLFKTFPDVPDHTLLSALNGAGMDEKKAIRNLKAKVRAAKALGVDLQTAERNENTLAPLREVQCKLAAENIDERYEREQAQRIAKMSAGEHSLEMAKTEGEYLTVTRQTLSQAAIHKPDEGQFAAVAEAEAVALTSREEGEDAGAEEDETMDGAKEGSKEESAKEGAAEQRSAAEPISAEPLSAEAANEGSNPKEGSNPDGENGEASKEGDGVNASFGGGGLPLRRLEDFVLHDANGQLARLEALDHGAKLWATGFVGANWDAIDDADGFEEGQQVRVASLGPFSCYVAAGYSAADAALFKQPAIFLQTAVAEYELGEPAPAYVPLLRPLLEKLELCKRLVRSLESTPLLTEAQLVAAVKESADGAAAERENVHHASDESESIRAEFESLKFDGSYLKAHFGFVVRQLKSFDSGAERNEMRMLSCTSIREIASSLEISLPKVSSGGTHGCGRKSGGSASAGHRWQNQPRIVAARIAWADEGVADEAELRTLHSAAKIEGKTVSVGDAVTLQPLVMQATHGLGRDELPIVRIESMWAEGGVSGRMMVRVRPLWRKSETFAYQRMSEPKGVTSAFHDKMLLPDTETSELLLGKLKEVITVTEGAAAGARAGVSGGGYFTSEWHYSPKWASYSFESAEAPGPANGAAPGVKPKGGVSRTKRVSALKEEPAPSASATASNASSEKASVQTSDQTLDEASSGKSGKSGKGKSSAGAERTLNMLELYSGSGGLSFAEGSAPQAGYRIRSRWCCEWCPEEAATYKLNHPECHVFHMDCETFLEACRRWNELATGTLINGKAPAKVAKGAKGKKRPAEVSKVLEVRGYERELQYLCELDEKSGAKPQWLHESEISEDHLRAFVLSHRADLPLAENVDVIAGGPPCQGVSGFNLFRHSDDPLNDTKNQQTIVFCDMCLLQKPSYVIMENVVGILMFADSLVLKQCMQRFLSGGYQVRVGVCVSGTFGLPQNRARTILFGARQDEALPAYPKPTHKLPPVPISMMTNWMKEHLLNVPTAKESLELEAPLTLRDAFSDLPSIKAKKRGFGENAHNRAPKERSAQPYRAVKYKGKTSAGVPVEPQTDFQRDARQGCGEELHDHESFVLNTDDQERVERVQPGGCWRDLPEGMKTSTGKPMIPAYARSYRRPNACFGRLTWDSIVPTVVCRPEPHNRPIIHPDESRILSIRENARIQGFPDTYEFSGCIIARYRQVGNAVSPKLALALGNSLLAAKAERALAHA